ncbi:hypothetical protein A8F94_08845 [Bacillus sp. FJAT-27225]|nr:YhcH/YjgK/YiaL family protein [Bacillus sp. FJAT-27225]OCA87927.1 hypothetical protein A8F94_08845 [Bacillus sp. FJAT-27225]
MIADHLQNFELYKGIDEKVNQAVRYIQSHSFTDLQPGMHEVEGEEIFFNLIEYETKTEEERFWESHKKYLDLIIFLKARNLSPMSNSTE